ncbi:MAG: hypothetical protein F9K24_14790 [Leptonema illini]|uniref:Helix-turn-helix domain-containing protein n=1 Tax=Leptonema illini TaxID=183 RepID=A0A833LXZ4_9LEPT|nr:MAG: hypothetical protein F9K24_14790 [Leptonema illini]
MSGWHRTPNSLVDNILPTYGHCAAAVLLVILRYTLGYNRNEARISKKQIAARSMVSIPTVRRWIDIFVRDGLITVTGGGKGRSDMPLFTVLPALFEFDGEAKSPPSLSRKGKLEASPSTPKGQKQACTKDINPVQEKYRYTAAEAQEKIEAEETAHGLIELVNSFKERCSLKPPPSPGQMSMRTQSSKPTESRMSEDEAEAFLQSIKNTLGVA